MLDHLDTTEDDWMLNDIESDENSNYPYDEVTLSEKNDTTTKSNVVHVYICVYIIMCQCMYVRLGGLKRLTLLYFSYTYVHMYIYIHKYIRTYLHRTGKVSVVLLCMHLRTYVYNKTPVSYLYTYVVSTIHMYIHILYIRSK